MPQLHFSKYSACGNDFIMVDDRDDKWTAFLQPKLITYLCHRRFGIGADGLILLSLSHRASIRMRYFNADGSEGEVRLIARALLINQMCGNGIRSLMMFARRLGIVTDHCTCETKERRLELWHKAGRVTVDMGDLVPYSWSAAADVDGKHFAGAWLNTGYTLFVPNVNDVDVVGIGRKLRYHTAFVPRVNVNFIERVSANEIKIRTYERGVEAETLACGTGACASAVATAADISGGAGPIFVKVASGDTLEIEFVPTNDKAKRFTGLRMTGPAKHVFEGQIDIE